MALIRSLKTVWFLRLRKFITGGDNIRSIRSLAVLPFENSKTDDAVNSWISTAMRDEIRTRLGGLKDLTVKTGYKTLQESPRSATELSGVLKVDALVTGSYVLHEGRLQVRMFLVNGATGGETPLDSFEGNESEIHKQRPLIS